MIGTIRKHQQWLWIAVIGATIYSFVAYFNPSSRYKNGSSGGGQTYDAGSIFGEPITGDQLLNARNEAKIFYRLNANEWPASEQANQKVEEIAHQFLLVDAELRHNHITVTPEAAARFTKQIVGLKPDEALTKEMLDQVLAKLLAGANGEVSGGDFVNFVHLSAGQQYLMTIFGMTGQLITPKEAESFYRRENEPMVALLASFPAANYEEKVNPTAQEITDFYNKRQAQYRVPEKLELNYVEFSVSNSMTEGDKEMAKQLGTNLDQKVDELYVEQDPSAYKDETGTNQLSAPAAKAKIKTQLRETFARNLAHKDAIAFATKLEEGHSEQHPYTTDDLIQLAKKEGLTVKTTAPFDERTGPKEMDLPAKMLRLVFALRDDDPEDKDKSRLYISSPLVTEEAVYVIGLKKRTPSRVQPLADVRAQVVEDYRRSRGAELAREAGQKFEDAAKANTTQAKSFDQLCAAQGVKTTALAPFSMATPSIPEIKDRSSFQQLQSVAYTIPTGTISPFVPTSEGGFVVYVKQRQPVDETKMKEMLPTYLARMREQRAVAAWQQWLMHEYQLHATFPRDKAAAAG
ncbi:MAG TPA: SurA N-terminal domain-containing protein [Verrucomicrobiae bacterium]|jgi:hypothetical protein|nr:SurA N-terminal domain-containing protein [Verrucomicrobiae bacterium]